ncbi:TetR/AcrR family transcriptional regulator [Shewanella surugensis]|uniref:TetR/AcrR family transcriptional regulator n=1 Tax=Shewanella surugensis TaxID=212020 RepID=A0ABT0LBV3_9GAMM|nr:TetR/AcrR family transcriptional regulator [Shewanella surugensis]MCL1125178.1 TetR/AcrR family transcriptional regulator [Shewanella surugensis]
MKKTPHTTKQQIIDSGYALISQQGFTNVGLSQILKFANVPKGSFYHYFSSKEQFGEAIIHHYFKDYLHSLGELFNTPDENGYQKLMRYWQRWEARQINNQHFQQCLVVKLSAEVADLSEPMRLALKVGSDNVINHITHCIQSGIEDGSIKPMDPLSTAKILYQMWLGASLLNKLHRDGSAINNAMEQTQKVFNQSIKN